MKKLKPREVKQLARYLMWLVWQIIISKNGPSSISDPICLSGTMSLAIKKQNLISSLSELGEDLVPWVQGK